MIPVPYADQGQIRAVLGSAFYDRYFHLLDSYEVNKDESVNASQRFSVTVTRKDGRRVSAAGATERQAKYAIAIALDVLGENGL